MCVLSIIIFILVIQIFVVTDAIQVRLGMLGLIALVPEVLW